MRYSSVFEALGHETRLKVFHYIYQSGQRGVRPKELIDQFGIDSGTLDFHLKKLLATQLITLKDGNQRGVYCPNEHLPLGLTLLFGVKEANKDFTLMD